MVEKERFSDGFEGNSLPTRETREFEIALAAARIEQGREVLISSSPQIRCK